MLYVIIGPPAAGKSTWIREHRTEGSIIIDYDMLANTFAGIDPANHEHTAVTKSVTKAAREAAINEAIRHSHDTDIYIIHSTPAESTLDDYRRRGAEIITVDPGKATVMKRIKTERPKRMFAVAAKWYEQQKPKTTKERGYGHEHEKRREQLLRALRDGSPCEWCGKPMWRNKTRNWDGASLEADHENAIAHHGTTSTATRLLHRTCNRSRGAGHDERRPGATQAGGFQTVNVTFG